MQTSAHSALTLLEPAQQELPEAARVLDLADHRLDRLLAQAIARAPAGALELGRHLGHPRAGPDLPLAARIGAAVAGPARRQIAPDPARRQGFELASRQKPASAETSRGGRPSAAVVASSSGTSPAWSLALVVRRWATMIWCAASTASWPL